MPNRTHLSLSLCIAALLVFLHGAQGAEFNLNEMAAFVASDIGKASVYGQGSRAPIFIFEESHNSYTTNVEESIGLERLYTKFKLRKIGLEGYTKSHISTLSFPANRAVAFGLLKAGELNSAEFMALAYGVDVFPIEDDLDYVLPPSNDNPALLAAVYISAIAQKSFEMKRQAGTLSKDQMETIIKLINANDKPGLARFIIGIDEYAKYFQDLLRSEGTWADAAKEVKYLSDLRERAEQIGANVSSVSNRMGQYAGYVNARNRASGTMVSNALSISSDPNEILALIIGSGHTPEVLAALKGAGRSIILISPHSQKDGSRDIKYSSQEMARKYDHKLGRSDYINKTLGEIYPQNVKPRTVLDLEALAAKSELYTKIDDLVTFAFVTAPAGGGAGGGPPRPPSDFNRTLFDSPEFRGFILALSDDHFRGRHIFIDKKKLRIIKAAGGDSLLFPVAFLGEHGEEKKVIWVQAGRNPSLQESQESERGQLVTLLKQERAPERKSDGDLEKVDISETTTAVFGQDEGAVAKELMYEQ